jgi:hypothetical protein
MKNYWNYLIIANIMKEYNNAEVKNIENISFVSSKKLPSFSIMLKAPNMIIRK